jgi:alcohol dehydrogenase class IV
MFGEGVVAQLGDEARVLGKRVLVVTDPGIREAGLVAPIGDALDNADMKYDIFDGISSNPLEAELMACAEAYRQAEADLIVAVGGGSALDVGKLVRVAATHPAPMAQYDDAIGGDAKIAGGLPPMIAIPTTAGTGSEVGRSGVITIAATNRKTVIFSPRLIPTVAMLDPNLTTTMPPAITASTGFDALTHCIEAYCAEGDHPMADAIALSGISLAADSLEQAVSDGTDLKARGALLKAAMMGAVAFQKGLGACHSLAHPLSAELGMHHGLANALCLPAVLDFNRTAVPKRIADIARILGVRADEEDTLAFECAGAVRALRRKLGLAEGLGASGVEESMLPKLASLAIEDVCHKLNPRSCTEEDMLALYRASM